MVSATLAANSGFCGVCRSVRQQRDQLGIVVEHLLEVRHQPQRVDGIAREAAAQVIVDAALADVDQRVQDGLADRPIVRRQRLAPEQMQHRGLRKLRRAGEAAVDRVERLGQALRRLGHECGRQGLGTGRRGETGKRVLERGGVARDPLPILAPDPRDGLEHLGEAGPAVARFRREVGAAPKRLAGGRQEHGERPAALLPEQGERVLIDLIEIRPLLPVHLDADEMLVHQRRDLRVLEALVRHDVAPMAGGIADREQDRLVLRLGFRERGRVPGLPVHRVVPVLEQIGARGLGEAIAHGGHVNLRRSDAGDRQQTIAI